MTTEPSFYQGDSGREYQRSVHGDALDSPKVFDAKATLAKYRYFRDLSPRARVLEFGVGVGTNLAQLPNNVRHGYDLGEFAREMSRRRGIRVFDDPAEIPTGKYDLVLCRHVLEHVMNPVEILVCLRSYLASDGQLLLILPIERTNRHARNLPDADVNNHLYAWGPQHLMNLFRATGLRVVKHQYFWYSMQAKLQRFSTRPRIYSMLVAGAGYVRRQSELAVWAVRH